MPFRKFTFDAKPKDSTVVRGKFKPSRAAEKRFQSQLRKVAKVAGHIVESHVTGATIKDPIAMQRALRDYSKLIEPWAARQSANLLQSVQKSNERAYNNASQAIGTALKANVASSEVGAVATQLMLEQVGLIQSIPLEAGLRAQKIAMENVLEGTRAQVNEDTVAELKKQLGLSTKVAESRAMLIAVTETARANASFTQARASAVGAVGYIWRATMDGATRPAHAKMNGKYVRYDKPPTLSDGTKGHAGTFPRCRCYQEPVFED